jgi:PilZ domain
MLFKPDDFDLRNHQNDPKIRMNDPGKVQEKKLYELFEYLFEKRVIIAMHVIGSNFERLTCINGIETDAGTNWLLVDLPDGFQAAVPKFEPWLLRFNFNGPDQLEYIFSTRGGQISGHNLKIAFPDYVERLQRRKNFRMETPIGTKMLLKMEKIQAVLGLINISLGGALGALIKHNRRDLTGSLLSMDQRIFNAGILVPGDTDFEQQLIIVKKSEVRRIEHDIERNIYRYAFEFIDIEPNEKKKLTQSIYHFQRVFLKRR